MWFLIGFFAGLIFCFATDTWRVKMLLSRGYDNAVRDILEYGYYYNKDNERIDLEDAVGHEPSGANFEEQEI
jgi:hypothetical protein